MERENVLKEKSYAFALRVVNLYKFLANKKKEYVLSNQILRSGTSVGAMIREAEYAQSKGDFISKLSISIKEANETGYWLDLLKDSEYIDEKAHKSITSDCSEVLKLLTTSIKTAKKSMNNE